MKLTTDPKVLPTQDLKRKTLWFVLAVVGLIATIWMAVGFKAGGHTTAIDWLTKSPMDLVETSPGVFTHRGRTASAEQVSRTLDTASSVSTHGPSSGTMEITDSEWRGVTCLNGNMRTDGAILTSDVWWQVRLDKDDKLVYDLYPRHWKPGSVLKTPKAHTVEWRVKPGQTITQALVVWSVYEKK